MNIMTPFGDGAKFAVVNRSDGVGHILFFVDGHGYSRAIAHSVVTDPSGIELEWLAASAGAFHRIPTERDIDGNVRRSTVDAEQFVFDFEFAGGQGH